MVTRTSGPVPSETAEPRSRGSEDGNATVMAAHQQIARRREAASEWTGPDDPDNPRNFPALERFGTIAIHTTLAFISAFAGAVYTPAQEAVMEEFGLSKEVLAVMPLSLYNLGMAMGPLVGAPLSEAYGRKAVFVTTTPIFALFMLGASFAEGIVSFTICRFFSGMFASPNIGNTSASILDFTPPAYRGSSLGIYFSIPSLATGLAPLVGGFLVQGTSWRWVQWLPILMVVALYPLLLLCTRETYKIIILRRRAIRLGLADSHSQRTSASKQVRHFFKTLIARPLHMLCTEPVVTLVSLYNGLAFGILFTFVISVPWIFEEYYAFGRAAQSLAYLGIAIGTLLACCPFVALDIGYYQKRLVSWQQQHGQSNPLPPEHRLIAAMIGSLILPASLLIAGWTAEYRIHWLAPIFFQGLTMLSALLVYASACLFMLDMYGPLYGASASSAMMFCRYMFSFAFPMFALKIFQGLGAGWATTILVGLSVLMAPMPWCFWVFGKRIRARSRYELST